jgi:hypothetical protein
LRSPAPRLARDESDGRAYRVSAPSRLPEELVEVLPEKRKGVWTRGFWLLGTYLFALVGREQKLRIDSAAPSQVA